MFLISARAGRIFLKNGCPYPSKPVLKTLLIFVKRSLGKLHRIQANERRINNVKYAEDPLILAESSKGLQILIIGINDLVIYSCLRINMQN